MRTGGGQRGEKVDVPSPCIGVCTLDAQSVCTGCHRTLAEIAEWPDAAPERRLQIRQDAEARSASARASRDTP